MGVFKCIKTWNLLLFRINQSMQRSFSSQYFELNSKDNFFGIQLKAGDFNTHNKIYITDI